MRQAWLPKMIFNWPLPVNYVRSALLIFEPKNRLIESYIRSRWHFTEAPVVDPINGLVITIVCIIVAFPTPFANLGPALVIIIMGLGLLERDGLVQFVAITLGFIAMALIYVVLTGATALSS